MQKKRGISLIVLVITIIVMIILAAAIILSLNNAGIIGNANKAVSETDYKTVQTAAQLKYADYILDKGIIDFDTYDTIGEWIEKTLINDGTITAEQASMYRFKNNGEVVRLETEAEYNAKYTVTDSSYYTITNGVLKVKSTASSLQEIVIPYGVTEVNGRGGFAWSNLEKLVLPDTVKVISFDSFYSAKNLSEVVMSKNIREIRGASFTGSAWVKDSTNADSNGLVIVEGILVNAAKATGIVEIPNEVEWIGADSFKDGRINKVILPDSLHGISGYAFYNCSIRDGVNNAKNLIVEDFAFSYVIGDYSDEKYAGTFWYEMYHLNSGIFDE